MQCQCVWEGVHERDGRAEGEALHTHTGQAHA